MHHQVAQEATELLEVFTVKFAHFIIGRIVMAVVIAFARRGLVIDAVETFRNRDDDRGDRQRIQERRQYGRDR